MDWQFCPYCETQLDEETSICPACRWDPLAPAKPDTTSDRDVSLVDRYRGTEYDSAAYDAAMVLPGQAHAPAGRARTIVLVGILALVGLYGSMVMYSDIQAHRDRPAIGAQP